MIIAFTKLHRKKLFTWDRIILNVCGIYFNQNHTKMIVSFENSYHVYLLKYIRDIKIYND